MATSKSVSRAGVYLSQHFCSGYRELRPDAAPRAPTVPLQRRWLKHPLRWSGVALKASMSELTEVAVTSTVTPTKGPAHRTNRGDAGSFTRHHEDLERAGDEFFALDRRPIVLFDGVCNMCNESVNFMLDHDPEGKLRYAALQSDAGKKLLVRSGRRPDDHSSIVIVYADRAYAHSDAVLHIAQCLQPPVLKGLGSVGLLVPGFARDPVYNLVSANRHRFRGEKETCRFLDEEALERFVE